MKKTIIALLALSGAAFAASGEALTFSSDLSGITASGGSYAGFVFSLADNDRVNADATVDTGLGYKLTGITLQSRSNNANGIAGGVCLFIVDSNKTLLAVSEAITSTVANGATATFTFNDVASPLTNAAVNNKNSTLTLGETYYAFLLNSGRYSDQDDRNYNASIGSVVPSNPQTGNPWCDSNTAQLAAYGQLDQATAAQLTFLNGANGSMEGRPSPAYVPNMTISGVVIPEPATATLSLLALASLAARRRRH